MHCETVKFSKNIILAVKTNLLKFISKSMYTINFADNLAQAAYHKSQLLLTKKKN